MKYFLKFFLYFLIGLIICKQSYAFDFYLVYVDSTTEGPGALGHILMWIKPENQNEAVKLKSDTLEGMTYTFSIQLPEDQKMNWNNIFEFRSFSKFEKKPLQKIIEVYNFKENRNFYAYKLKLSDLEKEKLFNLYEQKANELEKYSYFSRNNNCAVNNLEMINSVITPERYINNYSFGKWTFQNNQTNLHNILFAFMNTFPYILNFDLYHHPLFESEPEVFLSRKYRAAQVLQQVMSYSKNDCKINEIINNENKNKLKDIFISNCAKKNLTTNEKQSIDSLFESLSKYLNI